MFCWDFSGLLFTNVQKLKNRPLGCPDPLPKTGAPLTSNSGSAPEDVVGKGAG